MAFRTSQKSSLRGCLVVDLSLSDQIAIQFIEDLSGAGFDIPVIVTADYDPDIGNMPALPASVIALLQKPFMDGLLADTIELAFAGNRYP